MATRKLRSASEAQLEELKLDMSPMIDMVFLLLIFFMVSAVMIDYRKDKNVQIPVAVNARKPETTAGRVIVNIYNDYWAEQKGTRFADVDSRALTEEEITQMVERVKARNEQAGIKTRLHIRGDREADVEYTKRAVKAAGAAGVMEVIFSSYTTAR